MKTLFSTAGLRMTELKYRLLWGVIAVMTVMAAQYVQADSNPCTTEIRDCTVRTSGKITLGPWETRAFDIFCPAGAPYYRTWSAEIDSNWVGNYSWSWTGFVGQSHEHFTATNWDLSSSHNTTVFIACSTEPQSGLCVADPGCPDAPGSRQDTCADWMCWTNWNEICDDGSHWICTTATLRLCCQKK